MNELRPIQKAAIEKLRASLGKGHKRVIFQAPTGFGKTEVASEIVRNSLGKGKRVLFIAPALSLIDQTLNRFIKQGIAEIGVIQADHSYTNPLMPVQIASVQTLQRRPNAGWDVILVDEAHRWFKFYKKLFEENPAALVIGLSATPWTVGLGKHYSDLVIAGTTQEMIEAGYLCPFRVFAPTHPDLSGIKTVRGDYDETGLAEAMDKAPLIADVVQTWLEKGEGRQTLCFCVNRAHAKNTQRAFEAVGVPCGYVDAFTKADERKEIEERLSTGEISIVCNVGCLTTGVDWPISCIILARPTKSEMLFTQIIGRGLRNNVPGKQDCIILDHSDTHLRLGFVTDIYHDTLDYGKEKQTAQRKKSEALPKECPQCSYLKTPKQRQCPVCGFVSQSIADVPMIDGELTELGHHARKQKTHYSATEKQDWYSMLLYHAHHKGYSQGWAYYTYKDKFGMPPHKHFHQELMPTTDEVYRFIKAKQIRYIKSKKAQG